MSTSADRTSQSPAPTPANPQPERCISPTDGPSGTQPPGRPRRKLGALGTAVLMALVLFPLARLGFSKDGPFRYVLSGAVFTEKFDRIHAGHYLDQPTIGKWYFLTTFFSAAAIPCMALVRWMSHRRTLLGYLAYVAPAAAVCACLVTFLTVPFTWLVKYIQEMGFTAPRVLGLGYGLAGYLVILGFLCWAAIPPPRARAG